MKNILKYITAVLLNAFLFIACIDDDETTITQSLGFYNRIYLNDVFHVTLVQDSTSSITIRGAEELVKSVSYSIEDSILTLQNDKKFKWIHPADNTIDIVLHSPEFYVIIAYETCEIISLDTIKGKRIALAFTSKLGVSDMKVDCEYLSFFSSSDCGGRSVFEGKADKFRCRCKGLSDIDAKNLKTKHLEVEQSSKIDCELYSDSCISYSIFNVGNIITFGSPEIVEPVEITSSGRLVLME